MWECNYGSEPVDMKLLALRFAKKIWIVILAAVLGAVLVGGPYYLRKVTFGPAKEYQAVTDFYVDYALMETGEQYTYFNQTTWTQLIGDDVFTDKILAYLQDETVSKDFLRNSLYATMLSDTRIVTTTVTTNSPEQTMKINEALVLAMQDFGAEQKEIAGIRILQEPTKAELVKADVRTFRACMLGTVLFVFATLVWMWCAFALDDSIYVPIMFERRYHLPMLGTINSKEMPALFQRFDGNNCKLLVMDSDVNGTKVAAALKEKTGEQLEVFTEKELLGSSADNGCKVLLIVKAGAHNGKAVEKMLSLCVKCGVEVVAALLWDADEMLIKRYEGGR